MITSTVLTLLVIPTIYEILDDWRLKAMRFMNVPVRPRTDEYAVPKQGRKTAATEARS